MTITSESCRFIFLILLIDPLFISALDAMKKAYEDNLKKEKERFREALKTMYTEDYVVDLIQTHE